MTASARFAETDFPAEVEDLMSSLPADCSPSCCAVAGYAIIASPTTPHALVFAIAAGSGLDAVSIPLQPRTGRHAPALAAWTASQRGDTLLAVAVAALTRDAVLRVYRSVDVRSQTRPRADQVRVGTALASSVRLDVPPPALRVCRATDGALYVFGGRGSAAIVHDRGGRLEVHSLLRSPDAETGSIRFGAMFYSAIRSIGAVAGARDDDWEKGEGPHYIIACSPTAGAGAPGVIVVRRAGEVERWGPDGLLWTFSVFDFEGGRESTRSVLSAGVTSDDTAVLLVQSRSQSDPGHKIVCFDVRSAESTPRRTEMVVSLNDDHVDPDSQRLMVVSGDIAYFYVEAKKTMAWLSVARGVSSEGQVQGSTTVDSDLKVLSIVDASFGLLEAATTGGIAAFIHASGVWLVSSAVPAPISLDKDMPSTGLTSVAGAVPVFWRSLLQYSADQKGAAKASLLGLVKALMAEGFDVTEALSELVETISRKIIVSDHDPENAPMNLLVDTELEKKYVQHRLFLKLLTDAEVFSEVRPDAPSVTEDRIWDAMKLKSRYAIVTDGEKLASARRVRDLENRHASGEYYHRFNDAASHSLAGSDRVMGSIVSKSMRENIDEETAPIDGQSVLSAALALGGADICGRNHEKSQEDGVTRLYRYPHEFHRFLPSLDRCMSESLSRLQSEHNMADDNGAAEGAAYRRAAQNTILLSCEAAIEVVQGSREARETAVELMASLPNSMNGVDNWMSDPKTCGGVLMKIAQKALEIGARSRQSEGQQMMRAAALVIDELLSRTSFDETMTQNRAAGQVRRPGESTPQKRRRIDPIFEGTERGKEVRAALDMLRERGMDYDAFGLAEKYGDYGTMLALRVSSLDFDNFMEDGMRKFGDEFGLFCFHWLEERGQIRLLLRGQTRHPDANKGDVYVGRSDRLNALLSRYFRTERGKFSNLAWIHWISQGDADAASDCLVAQTRKISVPGKKGSAINTAALSSIAKLAMQATESRGADVGGKHKASHEYVTGRLLLTKLQAKLEPEGDTLRSSDDLIRQFIDESPTGSESLAENVVMAIEALQYLNMEATEAQNLQDYVWRRCVERQSNVWVPVVRKMSTASDVEMRQRLQDTALYRAAARLGLSEKVISEVIGRGALEASEFAKLNCVSEVARLVRVAVSLAVA